MSITVYGLKNCDTCRRAMKELAAAGHAPELVDVRTDGVPRDVMARALDRFGDALLNRRSTTWRGLDDAARADDPAALLAAHPTVMKRPLIEGDGTLTLGWDAATRSARL